MEIQKCDIAYILQNAEFDILTELASYFNEYRVNVNTMLDDATAYETECYEKIKESTQSMVELQKEIETIRIELDECKLEQTIITKKISNAIKQQDELKNEIQDATTQRNDLCTEIVDLEKVYAERKKQKRAKWNAIKLACSIYKDYLDFHLGIKVEKEYEYVKVSFFISDNFAKDKYFLHLLHHKDRWTVEEIQPILSNAHINELKDIGDLSNLSEVLDITAFLCQLRRIFLMYYVKAG
ncbi:hypothetical protein KM043_013658 [Ampulex compressa]|nr:hypothetical protein KM043_013658 [Ampulex compressa]